MDRILALIIAIVLSAGYACGEVVYHSPFTLTKDSLIAVNGDYSSVFEAIEIRATMPKISSNEKKESYYGLRWHDADTEEIIELRITPFIEGYDTPAEKGILEISAFMGDSLLHSGRIDIGIDIKRLHSVAIEFFKGQEVVAYAGTGKLDSALRLPSRFSTPDSLTLFTTTTLKVDDLIHETLPDPAEALITDYTLERIKSIISERNNAGHAGFWTFLDRNIDEEYAKVGGKYTLAVIPTEANGFDIIYVSGGTINPEKWRTGMLKGRLTPTIFKNHYNLQWYDAEMNELIDESSAQFDENNAILTLTFPLHKSTLRLSKIVNPQTLRDM